MYKIHLSLFHSLYIASPSINLLVPFFIFFIFVKRTTEILIDGLNYANCFEKHRILAINFIEYIKNRFSFVCLSLTHYRFLVYRLFTLLLALIPKCFIHFDITLTGAIFLTSFVHNQCREMIRIFAHEVRILQIY